MSAAGHEPGRKAAGRPARTGLTRASARAGNFDFGVTRVVAALSPSDRRLTPATWAPACRCLLALAELAAKQLVHMSVRCAAGPIQHAWHVSHNCEA